MASKQSASKTLQSYLHSVESAVAKINDPATGKGVQIPDFAALYDAAGRLDDPKKAAEQALVIQSLLGRASSYGIEVPGRDYKLTFPTDHALHPAMGREWYWIGCNLNTVDQEGNDQRLGVLMVIVKDRIVGNSAQATANWDDQDALIFTSTATVIVEGSDEECIYRRNKNIQWPLVGGNARFSLPGDDFLLECGGDSLEGSLDVLPLRASINDGNMVIQLDLECQEGLASDHAFFLEGNPKGVFFTADGTGDTPVPTPGLYYSWPQVVVKAGGTIQLVKSGQEYTVTSGSLAWIDHQLLMSSLDNPHGSSCPIPFVDDPTPFKGWSWQFFNLQNGDAFACASFQAGELNIEPPVTYGYYLKFEHDSWKPYFFLDGKMELQNFREYPVEVGCNGPNCEKVSIPNGWSYSNLGLLIAEPLFLHPLEGTAFPWGAAGTFNADLQILSEMPATYSDTSKRHCDGVGFCESVGFESVISYRNRALRFLAK